MSDKHWSTDEYAHIWLPYCQMKTAPLPLKVAATDRECITLSDGRRIIDGIASWWTACHGYNHPHIVESVTDQLRKMPHVMMGGICHDQALKLTARLAHLAPGALDRVFLCDSGSVAVEVALKIAVQFWLNQGQPNRNRFVCFQNAYHGDTTGAMSVCDPVDSMHSHFKGFLLEQFPAAVPQSKEEFEAFDDFLASKRDGIAGVILEPLAQMGTGMHFHTPDQLRRIYECCKRQDLLFIADEIATGFGRTGTIFAVEQAEIVPDIMCIGKALTGGVLSLAATIATTDVYSAFESDDSAKALMHGPTFMGNPLACSAANASLDVFEKSGVAQQPADIIKEARPLLGARRRELWMLAVWGLFWRLNSRSRCPWNRLGIFSWNVASGCDRSATCCTFAPPSTSRPKVSIRSCRPCRSSRTISRDLHAAPLVVR